MDKRALKSRKAIQCSFLFLVNEKGFANVTVQDIVRHCDINRSTFYKHYVDKSDLLNQIIDEQFTLLMKDVEFSSVLYHPFNPHYTSYDFYIKLFQHIITYREFYQISFKVSEFQEMYTSRIFETVSQLIQDANTQMTPALEMMIQYSISGELAILRWWISQEHPPSIEETSKLLAEINEKGVLQI